MKKLSLIAAALLCTATAWADANPDHPGTEYIEEHGYNGPSTCEECHEGAAKQFLTTVHWTHASKVTHVDNVDPNETYGMKNRIYTMCNGNDIVNNLKQIPKPPGAKKEKFSGCNKCHPGDHINDIGSTGPAAEASIDCLLCHSTDYDFRKRKVSLNEDGVAVISQDRSKEAAMAIGKPTVKNCMVCHESAGGGVLIKRGFAFTKRNDVHAKKGMVCVDCHKAVDHRIPTGFGPNNWAHDGLRLSCEGCHKDGPHADEEYNGHTARIACQTCHIPHTGGAYAKDFTKWTKTDSGYYEPTTLFKDAKETKPVYAWYDLTVANRPDFIGPKGSRVDTKSRIYPFKVFEGRAYFDKISGNLLSMDFAPPMSTGDTLAGVAAAAKILGIEKYDPVPGWQTIYFGNNHLVTKSEALTCPDCHSAGGAMDYRALGYSEVETSKLTSAATYFDKASEKLADEW